MNTLQTPFTVAFICNRLTVEVKDDIERFVRYEKERLNLDIRYILYFTDLDLTHKPFGIYTVQDGTEKELYGLDNIKPRLRDLRIIPRDIFHWCVFLYDLPDTKFEKIHPKQKVAHFTYWNELHPGTTFTEIATKQVWDAKDDTFRVLTHEVRHAFVHRIRRAGQPVPDYMDSTPVLRDGITFHPYYKEHDVYAPDGNRATTDRAIRQYLPLITQFPALTTLILDTMQKIFPAKKPNDRILRFAEAIKRHEGWFVGSRSYRNNNPGNYKFVGQHKALGADPQGFAIFRTYDDGWNYLITMLTNAATGKSRVYTPTMSLYDFFRVYAPSSDNNDPDRYAEVVAKHIGVSPRTLIRELTV